MLEFALIAPILFGILVSAFVLGYGLLVRMNLSWQVRQQAYELARSSAVKQVMADASAASLVSMQMQSFSVPGLSDRGHVVKIAVPALGDYVPVPFVAVSACYPMPAVLPRWATPGGGSSAQPSDPIDQLIVSVTAAENMAAQGEQLAPDIYDKLALLRNLQVQFAAGGERRNLAIRALSGGALDLTTKYHGCGDGWALSATTVVWGERWHHAN